VARACPQTATGKATGLSMDDYQFRAIRSLFVVAVILLGLIAGLLLAFAWEYL
jgi:hypothetical protein